MRNLHFELDYVHENEKWWEQEPLKTLDLSHNSLKTIEPQIENLLELTTLYVNITVLYVKKLHMKYYILNFYNFYSYIIICWKNCLLKWEI